MLDTVGRQKRGPKSVPQLCYQNSLEIRRIRWYVFHLDSTRERFSSDTCSIIDPISIEVYNEVEFTQVVLIFLHIYERVLLNDKSLLTSEFV